MVFSGVTHNGVHKKLEFSALYNLLFYYSFRGVVVATATDLSSFNHNDY
jgi:hypothetical protein